MTEGDPNFLNLFSRERHTVALKRGDTLFKKGDPAQSMFVVLSGELRVSDELSLDESIGAGGIVGEMALIDQAPRSATVTATADTTVAELDEKRFLFLVSQTPSFALNVMRVLSGRLRRTNARASA